MGDKTCIIHKRYTFLKVNRETWKPNLLLTLTLLLSEGYLVHIVPDITYKYPLFLGLVREEVSKLPTSRKFSIKENCQKYFEQPQPICRFFKQDTMRSNLVIE